MTAERWQWLRDRMPVTRDYAYMNSGWSGPLSTPVVEAMKARLDLELEHGPTTRRVMDDRVRLGERFRQVTAQMLNADADEIAIMGNTTEGVNVAVNGIDFQPGDQVVISTTEHSSGVVPAYYLRERYGVEVVIVQCGATSVARSRCSGSPCPPAPAVSTQSLSPLFRAVTILDGISSSTP